MSKSKIAVVHFTLMQNVKGGGEIIDFLMRDYYDADFFTISYSSDTWGKHNIKTDSFAKKLHTRNFEYLIKESKIPVWRKFKRILACRFSKVFYKRFIEKLNEYDTIIFSDDIPYLPRFITKPKKVLYRHTNPFFLPSLRYQQNTKIPKIFRWLYKIIANWETKRYTKDLDEYDTVISNSDFSKKVLETDCNISSEVIFPAIDTSDFAWISQKDYFISYSRLEEYKRIPTVVQAFKLLPEKKLVLAHTGSLENWVKKQDNVLDISKVEDKDFKTILRNLDTLPENKNILYIGAVQKEFLTQLVGNSLAGIVIPKDEPAGMTQCEIMAAGKPVIGSNEGGVKETIIDRETGILIDNPTPELLAQAIQNTTPRNALKMRQMCEKRVKEFGTESFFKKLNTFVK